MVPAGCFCHSDCLFGSENELKITKGILDEIDIQQGATFGIYDIMKKNGGVLAYPVPWATENSTSILATPEQYRQALSEAGFKVSTENNRREFGLEFFKQMKAKNEANGGPPPLGLHTLMQESTPVKLKNMIDNIVADYIAPVEIIAQK